MAKSEIQIDAIISEVERLSKERGLYPTAVSLFVYKRYRDRKYPSDKRLLRHLGLPVNKGGWATFIEQNSSMNPYAEADRHEAISRGRKDAKLVEIAPVNLPGRYYDELLPAPLQASSVRKEGGATYYMLR